MNTELRNTTMRAIILPDAESALTLGNLPIPEIGANEALVRVHAASLNGFDLFVAAGYLKGMMEHRYPAVVGKDFAGTVTAVGPNVSRFSVGDQVFGVVSKPFVGDGSYGEYIAIPEDSTITHVPAGLDLLTVGALGLAGTAALMTVEAVAPTTGESVLVSGATGGVGAFAVQLAAARGAEVIATAQPGEEADFVRSLGATHVVDYTGDLVAAVRIIRPQGVDAVVHLAGDALQLADLLVAGGRIASLLGISPEQLGDRPVTATTVMADATAARLDYLAAEVVAGRLRVPVQRTYTLEEVPQALADFGAGKLGKLGIAIR